MALYTVKLLEPELCLECRFNQPGKVKDTLEPIVVCKRRDCDNWITTDRIKIDEADLEE